VQRIFFLFIHYSHATYLDHGEIVYSPLAPVQFFFFVYSYSHATYIDHGGVHFTQFSCPPSARWRHVASSPFALLPGLSQKDV